MRTILDQKTRNKNKKDSERDKKLYPALNNQINQDNIMDYFVFDEDENNIITNVNKNENKNRNIKDNIIKNNEIEEEKDNNQPQKLKVEYNVSSFITSSFRPDLYSPYGVISGNKYKLRMAPGKSSQKFEEEENEENENEEKELKKEEDKESSLSSNEKENNDEFKIIKSNRYYNIEPDISIKCHICGQIGHRKDICPNSDIKFCYRCLSDSHDDRDCDQVKCFRCNRLGHKTYNCQLKENKLIICETCHCIGHQKNECLIKPMEFSHKFLKYNNLHCFNCGSKKHVLCSLVNRELPELKKEDDNEIFNDENIFINNDNNEYNEININNNIDMSDDERSSLTPKNEEEENKNIEIKSEDITIENEEKNEKNEKNKKNEKKEKKKKKQKNIFEDLKNEDIKNTMFCGFCGGRHRNEECEVKNDEKFSNKFDIQRKNVGKRIYDNKRKEEERKKEEQNKYFSFNKRNKNNDYNDYNNKNNNNYQQNKSTKFNNKYNNKYKDKSNSNPKNKKNKGIPLNEDDSSENENDYNKNFKNKSNKNYKNKSPKISKFY